MPRRSDVAEMLYDWWNEGVRVLYLQTYDEAQAFNAGAGLADQLGVPLWRWSMVGGLVRSGDVLSGQLTRDPEVLVDKVLGMDAGVIVAYDLLASPLPPRTQRAIKELTHPGRNTFLIMVGSLHVAMPESLRYDVLSWIWGGVDMSSLYRWSQSPVVSLADASRRQQIALPGLELIRHGTGWREVGGLTLLKAWADQRKLATHPELHLPFPRGVLLAGIPGTGKSLSVRAFASDWDIPLFRLNWAGIMGRYVGQSEAQLAAAIDSVEMLAPAILWIDEIDKAIGRAGSESDGGVSRRLLGWLLTWLQEHQSAVMLMATANEVETLPAELLRPGRFDALFFVDLPDSKAREEILFIHLQKIPVDDMAAYEGTAADWTDFSGADIQEAVMKARFLAAQRHEPLTRNVLQEAGHTVIPWARTLKEEVSRRRDWAKGRMYRA